MFKNTSLIITALALAAIAFLPINLYFFSFLYIAPFFIFLIQNNNVKTLLTGTFLFSFFFLLVSCYAAFEPLLFTISSIIFLGLPISFYLIKKYNWAIFTLPILWTIWDILRGYLSPLPLSVSISGNILGLSPFVGLANFGGIVGLTLFTAIVNFLIALTVLKIKNRDLKTIKNLSLIILFITLFGYLVSWQQLKNNREFYQKLENQITIAAISINSKFDKDFDIFPNDELTNEEKILAEKLITEKINILKNNLKDKSLDLLVLPEDMMDITLTNNTDEEAYQKYQITNAQLLINAYRQLAKKLNSNVLSVMTTVKDGKRRISSVLFNKRGEIIDVYDKSTLTIGSEYWPFRKWRPFYYNWIGKIIPEIKDDSPIFDTRYSYEKGEMKILKTESVPTMGSPICVEIFYPAKIKSFKNLGAEIIIHSSSNIWAVDYGLNTYIDLTNKIRAIESVWLKLPILSNGRQEPINLVTPDGKTETSSFEQTDKDYNIEFKTVRF